jgi:mono/diheme cytochrome c family protein
MTSRNLAGLALAVLGLASCAQNRVAMHPAQDLTPGVQQTVSLPGAGVIAGRSLFLKNCAHCHGDDARGDEGPDLHGLSESDDWIARRIRNGVKGEMTAFGAKFSPDDVGTIIAYLRTLK